MTIPTQPNAPHLTPEQQKAVEELDKLMDWAVHPCVIDVWKKVKDALYQTQSDGAGQPLLDRLETMRKALEFYEAPSTYQGTEEQGIFTPAPIVNDSGRVAREALKETK